tara:strand:+ start:5467 stop:6081 length:615 start_codon:yes stop_codon:yes gene_type:complete
MPYKSNKVERIMIEFIEGILYNKCQDNVVVNVNGVGYRINISINSYSVLPDKDKKVHILTYFNVSENSQELYGFMEKAERELFIMLISVSGIGPKTALGMLSAVAPDEFKNRLIAGEVKMLTALPGIGPKTAKRIIIELKDKFIKTDEDSLPIEDNNSFSDAFYALKSLGYNSKMINAAINKVTMKNNNMNLEDIVKESLKVLK